MRTWLRTIRQMKGLTEKAVAEKAGVTQTFYHYIETGERNPMPRTAKAIAKVLGFDWTLFYEDGKSA